MKPRLVVQQETTGCGIACAAMLAGISYTKAKQAAKDLGISPRDPALWSDTQPMHRLLAHLKIKTAQRQTPFTGWEKLPERALLAIKWHRENGVACWHWTVFVRENGKSCVLDPKKTLKHNRRTDLGRMRPKWFITVNP